MINHNFRWQRSKQDQLQEKQPIVEEVDFHPSFSEQLYFVYLNEKQNSRNAIQNYNERKGKIANEIKVINAITSEMQTSSSLVDFNLLVHEHEAIIADIIKEVSKKALSRVILKLQKQLGKAEQSAIINRKITQLGE